MTLSAPKGVFDLLPYFSSEEARWQLSYLWRYLEEKLSGLALLYGFSEIRTPIFESSELFVRAVGETSDIVSKEMYTFTDKGDRSLTLRPEGTASVMRAFIEHNLHHLRPVHKLFYIGPMFRYERPQAGRFRQHHQFGVESIGIAGAEADAEVIELLCHIYTTLGLQNICVQLNSVGDSETRARFKEVLKTYLEKHFSGLSKESQERFHRNPLRILDSKAPEDQQLLKHAPSIVDCLTDASRMHFEHLKQLLDDLKIHYQVNPKLVRGLDYYNKTVFEVTSSHLGSQNAIGGGGRYDGLMHSMGGPDLPSVGFAIGLERVLQTLLAQKSLDVAPPQPVVYLIGLGERARRFCFKLLCDLRHAGVCAEMDLQGKKIGAALNYAVQLGAKYALVVGDQEIDTGQAKIKKLDTREEELISLDQAITWLISK